MSILEMPLWTLQPLPPPRLFDQDDSFSKAQVSPRSEQSSRAGMFFGEQEDPKKFAEEELYSRFIVTTDREKTIKFVESNDLLLVLLQSEQHVKDAFGESSLKTLAMLEDDEGCETLFCLVKFWGTLADARAALKSFDDAWWLRNAKRFSSKLNFDFELA